MLLRLVVSDVILLKLKDLRAVDAVVGGGFHAGC